MEFDGLRRASNIPNLTPLIDIVFLLLVFFMLTAHFVKNEAVTVDLPEADSATPLDIDKAVEVVINGDGKVSIAGMTVELGEVEEVFIQKFSGVKNKKVAIRGDERAGLGVAVSIFDSARKAGAEAVDIITERPE
ncbi:MAG: biopolymer transporter ExbD [Nitrospinota bacterium]|nr:biopolymer transporter ExbD [Nitrospinota bacterium]